ncbi:MAG TPA: UDP-N-acetylmuramoyl-tripeptide--D-alanyl-D-alanine ligase [Clostridiales bacterium]|nr:UDP-N-acetylmuramoyl-tripeptide--D-alanyl-D-alanine ligase [Clostridiales bacterium]
MIRTDIQSIARACGGRIFGNQSGNITGVVIDSRDAKEELMFVAVIGPNKDGHDYLTDAMDRGCRVFLISQEERTQVILEKEPTASIILTGDTEQGLTWVAQAYLEQFDLYRVAVTGSVGKTTTKEMTARVLCQKYHTISTVGNLNTTLGQCLTAFQADRDTEAIVFEMGMDRKGELESYCRWIRPQIAVITNVGTAHLEHLGTREAIADAKLEIATYLGPKDVLIFNSDSDFLSAETVEDKLKGRCMLCPVGTGADAQYQLTDIRSEGDGVHFALEDRHRGLLQSFTLPILGIHNALNASLSAAVGAFLNISLEEASEALFEMQTAKRRLHVEIAGGVTLIDDTYNAGPDSMKAALDVLAAAEGRRRIAVLADILELGSYLEEGHLSVGRYVAEKNPDVLIAIGDHAKYYAIGAEEADYNGLLIRCQTNEEALNFLLPELRPGDVVLVKGSNATGVAGVAEQIRQRIKTEEES